MKLKLSSLSLLVFTFVLATSCTQEFKDCPEGMTFDTTTQKCINPGSWCLSYDVNSCPVSSGCTVVNELCMGDGSLCQLRTTAESCNKEGCVWNGRDGVLNYLKNGRGICLSKTTSFCVNATKESTCNDLGCVWSEKSGILSGLFGSTKVCLSKIVSSCSSAVNEKGCLGISCLWSPQTNQCVSKYIPCAFYDKCPTDAGCKISESSSSCIGG